MALVLGRLGVTPPVFWSMTLPELQAMLRGALGSAAPDVAALSDRACLDDLMSRFPDRETPCRLMPAPV